MRLAKIKLSGFKSFVDPTTVTLPGDLVAIVGPNGCGKSNIIDAVRWVMGESSAKHLRGESMADVIFNGSGSRKPVGTASIELVFDNSDGTITGQYAGYNEIAVRRQVNRDGQSAYYLNGTRCRRRDITDIFLGTGLGPRSYSIIEQGMISRVIEARPEELRRYLEEAAGISLYKERRRETERRIRDTLENLERLEDVRDEVARQLEKLKRQADTAERYKGLRAEQRQRQAELHVLRLQGLEAERERLEGELRRRDTEVEAAVAEQRRLERETESVRARHAEDSDRLNEIQAEYYGVGSEITRLEQRMKHQREMREARRAEEARTREALDEHRASLEQDGEKLRLAEERVAELEPEHEALAEAEAGADEGVQQAQQALEDWRERWERFNEDAQQPARTAEVERARIEQLERQGEERTRQRERLAQEIESLDEALARESDEAGAERLEALEERLEGLRERLDERDEALTALEDEATELDESLEGTREERHRTAARLTSLETLQEAALGEGEAAGRWLAAQGLDDGERLARRLDVEPGWERAVEAVLGAHLQAVLVTDPGRYVAALAALEGDEIVLQRPADGVPDGASPGDGLARRVSAPWPVAGLFAGVHTAEDVDAALARAPDLAPGEEIVTPDGTRFGPDWVHARGEARDDTGVLARERDLSETREALETLDARLAEQEARRGELRERIADLTERRDDDRDALHEAERERASLQAQVDNQRAQQQERGERRRARQAELEDLAEAIEEINADVRAARERQAEALDRSEALDETRERLNEEKLGLQDQLDAARERLADVRSRRHDVALRLESATTARQSLAESVSRQKAQCERLEARLAELAAADDEPAEVDDEAAEAERQRLLERRQSVEHELGEARTRLGDAEERLRDLETRRGEAERSVTELREGTESARYRSYELKIRIQTQAEQLAEMEVDRAETATALPEDADEQRWEAELERLDERIRRLGPINLAAIDEYRELESRKGYLDSQYEDLNEALETLQSAIRRIDRETRQRFKETFEKVNEGMQRLFPRLFGGGSGYLELTGEDLLETGVAIMARPPGKRVSNIHLLSGGEKALTAVALVFAIFELNPAPFCMLDEVDAPLDEANVGRFCDMLQALSDRVQFIVITHNKVTMAAASHLAGVTMNEPGVSRLVAVDMEAATALVDTPGDGA
ncbi:Chromosome partition protein Smc [wastewater metagenome]|uniref:Chromosome partition protein Smc n=2 Tax=unclassified sequences TaxID=12908 RepID=A0A5B8RBU3_9ZZZZ|nr:chromosome partition protein Smc [uncultured organism]